MAYTPLVVKDANNATQSMAAMQDLAGINYGSVDTDSTRQTYRAGALFTPLVTAAQTLISIKGSATKTVRIKRIGISMVATANAGFIAALQRVTALGTGGTSVAPTIAKLDTNSAAATAVVAHYTTAQQTYGTGTGPISTSQVNGVLVAETALTIASAVTPLFPEFGSPIGQAIVLRGVSDFVEVQNLLPTNLSAATQLAYFVEWIEDAS